MKLGKLPARPNAVTFKLTDYVDTKKLTPPAFFGHDNLITSWGMLGNDTVGDCVLAGGAHETMMWTAEGYAPAVFTDECVLSDYSAITGYDPSDPNTDNGTDMQMAASYRRKTGLLDANGKRHKVAAYLAITPGNLSEHLLAAWLFGAVGIGINFPAYAMDEFNSGIPWAVEERKRQIEGGHYIPLVAHRGLLCVVTWGRIQQMTPQFFHKFNDESLVYLSEEMLYGGKSPEGFDDAQLRADLSALK